MKPLNKKANVPIMILVIGVVAICGFAILSFAFSYKFSSIKDSIGLEVLEKVNSDIEKFEFYKNIGKTPEQSAELIDAEYVSEKLIIEKSDGDKSIIIKYEE